MTRGPFFPAALAAALLAFSPAGASARPAPDPVTLGTVAEGELSVDRATIRTHGGWLRGRKRVLATIELADPTSYAAREITREMQTQTWDCRARRYKVVMRIFRTSSGYFVRSDNRDGPWIAVPEEGPLSAAFEMICPGAA